MVFMEECKNAVGIALAASYSDSDQGVLSITN